MKMKSKFVMSLFAAAALSGCGNWGCGSEKKDDIKIINKAGGCKIIVTNGEKGDLLCPPKACPAPAPKPEAEEGCGLDICGGSGGSDLNF